MTHTDKNVRDLATRVARGALPAELRDAGGIEKLDWVLGQPNVRGFIEELGTEELYLLVQDIGKNDAFILIEYASDDQLRGMVDLDAWQGQNFDTKRWLSWLDLCEAVSIDTALKLVRASEDELLELLFLRDVQVYPADFDQDTLPDTVQAFLSPDMLYVVTVPREHLLEDRLQRLMKLMWAQDSERARVILQQAQFDLSASTESYLRHFRSGRLQDLGFPDPTEAHTVFSAINVKGVRQQIERDLAEGANVRPFGQGGFVEDFALRGVVPPDLLGAALDLLDDPARQAFAQAFTYLVNKVFMAQTGDLSRTDDLPAAGEHAAALLNLGLESLSGGDTAQAAAVLRACWPETLFRVAHTLTFEVGLKARRVRQRAGVNSGWSLFGAPTDEALHGVALPRPLFWAGLEMPPRLGYRAFRSLADLAKVRARVTEADSVLSVFETRLGFSVDALTRATDALGGDAARATLRLSVLFRTGVAQALLSDTFTFDPLTHDELRAFARAAFDADGQLSPAVAGAIARLGEAASPLAAKTFARWLNGLAEAIGKVKPEDLDARFVEGLLLVRP